MNSDTKILLGITGLTVLVVGFIVLSSSKKPVERATVERGGVATGSATPKATLVEFSDFQCPACKTVDPVVRQLVEKNSRQLKFIYRHFPLPQHQLAFKAAQASLAAANQGKFWSYKEKLFEKQEELKESDFEEIAKQLSLDLNQFKKDLDSDSIRKAVRDDLNDAQSLGLPGTPSFFFNGERLSLTSFEQLQKTVEEKLSQP